MASHGWPISPPGRHSSLLKTCLGQIAWIQAPTKLCFGSWWDTLGSPKMDTICGFLGSQQIFVMPRRSCGFYHAKRYYGMATMALLSSIHFWLGWVFFFLFLCFCGFLSISMTIVLNKWYVVLQLKSMDVHEGWNILEYLGITNHVQHWRNWRAPWSTESIGWILKFTSPEGQTARTYFWPHSFLICCVVSPCATPIVVATFQC